MKLEPCPFCAGKPREGYNSGEITHIQCSACHAQTGYYGGPEQAVAAWNRRAAVRPAVTVGNIVSQIAIWSDDEGLDLSYGQGDDLARRILSVLSAAGDPVAWQPIETAPREQEVLIAYWRWRSSMSPGSIIVQSARQVEYHGSEIWSWVVEDNKHGPFPIRGWCDGDMIGWQPLPAAPQSGASHDE